MPLRTAHGASRSAGRLVNVEVSPPDELPPVVPAPAAPPAPALAFGHDGKILNSETAKELGRRGGLAKAQRMRLIDTLGLSRVADDPSFAPYRSAGDEFVRAELAAIAAVSGGVVGPGPASIVVSAGLQLACGRWMVDQAAVSGDAALMTRGSSLWNDSRTSLIAARELAGREAIALRKAAPKESLRERLLSAQPARTTP